MCRRLTKSRPACQKQRTTPVAYTHRLEPPQSVHYNPATATGVCVDFLAVEFLSPPGRLRLATGARAWETDRVISRAPYGAIARLGGLKRSVAPLALGPRGGLFGGACVSHRLAPVAIGKRPYGTKKCWRPAWGPQGHELRSARESAHTRRFLSRQFADFRELAGVSSVDSLSSIVYSLRCASGGRPARQPRWGC